MCGIAGYFNLELNQNERLTFLTRMCDCIIHRGPDDSGYFADEIAGIGMRRLSIIDLDGGHQPIANEDSTKHIVYNGEVYNYENIRSELIGKGHQFRTNSDTEVILHLYEEIGEQCVERLNGMFSLAIWDADKRKLFLARDRMGIKPLYYYWDGNKFLFASEIKSIIASQFIKPEINPQAIWHFLTFEYVPQPISIWKNIHKLLPGHTLTISLNQPEPNIQRYWDIHYEETMLKPQDKYIAEFEELFLDAVRLRLIADVPVGVLLSGGLDSSAIAAAISLIHNTPIDSFSVSFKDSPHTDESPFARQVAKHLGTNHHEVFLGRQEILDFLPRFVHYTDEPLADMPSIPLYYVSSLARQHVKVVLSGEGSDEILGGYGFDKYMKLVPRINQRANLYSKLASIINPLSSKYADRLRNKVLPAPYENLRNPPNMTRFMDHQQKRDIWNGNSEGFISSIEILKSDIARSKTKNPLHQILYLYAQSWLVEDLLMKADKMTMANSLELRVPFLDHRIVNWASNTPDWVKVKPDRDGNFTTKWVLREFARKHLPETIITRPKMGFSTPIYDWITTELKSWAHDTLANARLQQWLKPEYIERQLASGTAPTASELDKHLLWNLLILELWLNKWM